MDGNSLEPWQAARIQKKLPLLNYLLRLQRRMEQRGFPHDDKLCAGLRGVQRHAQAVGARALSVVRRRGWTCSRE
jgi:hypothetical protein